jgi:hypothetical protein
MEKLKPNEKRAKTAIMLIWIVLAIEIISLISSYFQFNLLQSAANGQTISMETAAANDVRERIIGLIYIIAYIISAITFIKWFRRAYFNLHQKVYHLSESEGWAAGCWFIPILYLYKPYQLMKELYVETEMLLTRKGLSHIETITTKFLGWWWALWIINNIIGQIIFRASLKAETITELTDLTIANIISDIIVIPLALITVKVIKDYSNVEPMLIDLRDEDETTINKKSYEFEENVS